MSARDCLGAGEHVGRSQGGARWQSRGVCRTCGKDLALTSSGRIPRHVPKKDDTTRTTDKENAS